MNEAIAYIIQIGGRAEEAEVNATSPTAVAVVEAGPTRTLLSARTDQSGLIGLLRHLHGLGYVVLSASRISCSAGSRVFCDPDTASHP